ncbi:RNA polymerase II C-terminal domain phosphatase-like 4 [Neltuma alba]|uniref:RNA polymerase II C-terminal domain phosphatase-like 4 n=1 Tax=Neltuma alba TaxID=207710 RepID=UPI0010A477E9|nr:RNA polymerase II C-terminal domain phosphatase-like 4 [Prosopis alba]
MGDRAYALEMAKLLDPKGQYFHSKAWMKHKDNLILMERYHFFASSWRQFGFNCRSLAESRSDECESDGVLARILNVLKQAHHTSFDVLRTLKSDVLKGCVLVFSRIVHVMLPALQKIAEQMGAICLTEVAFSVTRVVGPDVGTEKAR